jgi:hypothetical protein
MVVCEDERTRQEKRIKLSSLHVEDLLIKALFFSGHEQAFIVILI